MSTPSPKIDPRSYSEIVKQTSALVHHFTGWQPPDELGIEGDGGSALVGIFSRLAQLVSDRLNQVPDKNFLAFLDLIGTAYQPPQPARVPLTFSLVDGSPVDGFVPAYTQVAAPPSEEGQTEVVFELEEQLVVTRTKLQAVFIRQPEKDSYRNCHHASIGIVQESYSAFEGDTPIDHSFYLASDDLFTLPSKNLTLTFESDQNLSLAELPITWSFWNGEIWSTSIGIVAGLQVTLDENLPRIKINPGKAIDSQGREINLPQEARLDLNSYRGQTVSIVISLSAGVTVIPETSFNPNQAVNQVCLALVKIDSQGRLSYTFPTPQSSPGNWTVTLPNLPAVRKTTIEGMEAGWLRGRLHTPLPLNTSNLPTINGVSATAVINQTDAGLTPQQCVLNTVELDISKDFFPFGEQPGFNDTFYLAHGDVFSQPGATVTVNVQLSDPLPVEITPTDNLQIAWEAFNGKSWERLNIAGNQSAVAKFTTSGDLTLTLPQQISPSTVNLNTNYWLRVRIVAGNYGTITSGFGAPAVKSISLGYTHELATDNLEVRTYNDFTYTNPGVNPFTPFSPSQDQDSAIYLGFDQSFPNRQINLYAQVEALAPGKVAQNSTQLTEAASREQNQIKVKSVLGLTPGKSVRLAAGSSNQEILEIATINREDKLITFQENLNYDHFAKTMVEVVTIPPRLVWEYSSPSGWKSLNATDETESLTQRGLIRFLGAVDFTSRADFGQAPLYWLRLRWERGDFLVMPSVRNWLTNTTWASQIIKQSEEILGASNGNPNQVFTTLQTPILPGEKLEVAEELSSAEITSLSQSQGITEVRSEIGELEQIWLQWHEVPDFYGSQQSDRHYVLDRLTGQVRFGDGQQGMIPALGNNNLRLTYQTGGGEQGNLDSHTVTQLKTTIPYIDKVTNWEAARGGSEQESSTQLRLRAPKTLRHRGRAVTAQDLEDLAFAASGDVARAKAITPQFDPNGLQWLPMYNLADLKGTGEIAVTLNWQEASPAQLMVKIYGAGQAHPYKEALVSSGKIVKFTITEDLSQLGNQWRVTVTNPSVDYARVTGTITYPGGSQIINLSDVNSLTNRQVTDAGRVELIIVPQSELNQPTPSLGLLQRVEDYLLARCGETLSLRVTEPHWVMVKVTAMVAPASFAVADGLPDEVGKAITRFLHPLTGGTDGKGWSFGRIPHESDLYGLIESISGVDHVESLVIEMPEVDGDMVDRFLIYSGVHEIELSVANGYSVSRV